MAVSVSDVFKLLADRGIIKDQNKVNETILEETDNSPTIFEIDAEPPENIIQKLKEQLEHRVDRVEHGENLNISASSNRLDPDYVPDTDLSSDSENEVVATKNYKDLQIENQEVIPESSDGLDPDYVPDTDFSSDPENDKDLQIELDKNQGVENEGIKEKTGSKRRRTEKEKSDHARETHPLLPIGCSATCRLECSKKIDETGRNKIYDSFWSLDYEKRLIWMAGNIKSRPIKRKRGNGQNPKSCSRVYSFTNHINEEHIICQKFVISTLGYTSDKVIINLFKSMVNGDGSFIQGDKRGKHENHKSVDSDVIKIHINSFNPQISHYRRAHAPLRRYLPSNINVTSMYSDYLSKNPNTPNTCSYEKYRQVFSSEKITFGHPEMDKCDECAYYAQNVDMQEKAEVHLSLARQQRHRYQHDAQENWPANTKVFAADLQKVLLLPLMHDLKSCVFTSRLVVFNETFAEMSGTPGHKTSYLCLWDESIAGRNKEDLANTFVKVITKERDTKVFIFWLDNCAGQNKNWCLFSTLVTIVNLPQGPEKITLKYLIPGHTSMAADSIHGHIEKRLRAVRDVGV